MRKIFCLAEKKNQMPFEKVNARGKKKGSALSLTKKEDALSLTRNRVS